MNRLTLALAACLAVLGVAFAQDASSPLLQLLLMGNGLHTNDWGTNTNANFQKVEAALEGYASVSLSGGATTLTADQARYQTLAFTGNLSSNATVSFPNLAKTVGVINATSGSYTLTLNCGAGTSVTLTQGIAYRVFCDGATNMAFAITPIVDPFPIGAMMHYGGAVAPSNYLLCDGSAVNRVTYASLYAIIGTTYGVGDGVTTFNVPDARGRFLAGPDGGTTRLNGWALGQTGGASTTTLTTAQLPNHNHTVTDPGHTHGVTDPGHTHPGHGRNTAASSYGASWVGLNVDTTDWSTGSSTTGVTVKSATTGISTGNVGTGAPHSITPPTVVVNCIIRAK